MFGICASSSTGLRVQQHSWEEPQRAWACVPASVTASCTLSSAPCLSTWKDYCRAGWLVSPTLFHTGVWRCPGPSNRQKCVHAWLRGLLLQHPVPAVLPRCLHACPSPMAHLNPRRMFPRPSPQRHDAPQAVHLHRKLTASAWPPTCLSWPAPRLILLV